MPRWDYPYAVSDTAPIRLAKVSRIRRRIASSGLARLAALPTRIGQVGSHDATVLRESARWVLRSREHTNFTYRLQPLNLEHLAWWVKSIASVPVDQARGYLAEADQDFELSDHVRAATLASRRRGLADAEVRLHKRLGWYALVRALRPEHVVETGTDKGLGSVVLAAALLRNGNGRLTTIDVNPDSGYLVTGQYAEVTDRIVGNSVEVLSSAAEPVDMFVHDSWHTREYELAEFESVAPRLSERAAVLSDNAHASDALPVWAERTQRAFYYWQERPLGHWYPGGGIGLAR